MGGNSFQAALTEGHKIIGYINPGQFQNGILAPGPVDAFHIGFFRSQADESAIVQNTDRISFCSDYTFRTVGYEFQLFFPVQIGQRVIRIGRHSKAPGGFQRNRIFGKYRT